MSELDNDLLVRAQGRVGAVLRGKYRLDSVLGVGGMAVVYAATHRNKKRFAVKMLHPELSRLPDVRSRFLREGYAANSVEHPGAVAVLDDDVDENEVAFLVMELLDGETAEQLWTRSGEKLPLPVALAIGDQLLDVLVSAHAHGVIHRDVKPANLFLTRQGEVKLLDFGIARVRDAATSQATQTGSVIGTAGFMAPEQALGKVAEVDALTDVWGVGATVFHLATGRLVHEGETAQETIVLSATRPAPSLEVLLPDAPPAVVMAIDRALAFEKQARWPDAAAMRAAIREASLAAFGGVASLPPLPPPTAPVTATPLAFVPGGSLTPTISPSSRRRRLGGRFAAGAATVMVLAVFIARHRDASESLHTAGTSAVLGAHPSPESARGSATTIPSVAAADLPAVSPPDAAPSVSAKAVASSAASPTLPPRTRSKCNPLFFFDAQGNRVFKKECL